MVRRHTGGLDRVVLCRRTARQRHVRLTSLEAVGVVRAVHSLDEMWTCYTDSGHMDQHGDCSLRRTLFV